MKMKIKIIIIGIALVSILGLILGGMPLLLPKGEPSQPLLTFVTVGDIHAWTKEIDKTVRYINRQDGIDFVVFLGDIARDNANDEEYKNVKNSLSKLNKTYYILAGNHDDVTCADGGKYSKAFGKLHQIHYLTKGDKTYQIITASYCESDNWNFLFDKADKNLPTIVFTHGPVIPPKSSCEPWEDYHKYNYGMKSGLDQFTNLIGVYAGHVHEYTNQMIGGTRYVTEESLAGATRCGLRPTRFIGYTKVYNDGNTQYSRLDFQS